MSPESSKKALACVLGGIMDMVRPLGLGGIPCAVVTAPGVPSLYSRFTKTALICDNFSASEELFDALVRFGSHQSEPPVLFYAESSQLLLVSRFRDRLAQAFRFVIAEPTLVEDLVDKGRFQVLAERLHLPVPATRRIHPGARSNPPDLDLPFPVILKPLTRREPWKTIGGDRKAIQVDTPAALRYLWPSLIALGMDLLAQELIPGPETRIESYHVYVDSGNNIVGEFTGEKIRTEPPSYGHSTALIITDKADVRALGRTLVEKLQLQGVAKFDFKRGPDGRLHLLEINPRFNLWHHPGAIAGVNLPALVYADMVGLPRPAVARARAGVRWCLLWKDLPAARAAGVPLTRWLPWALRCEAKSTIAWDDPLPLVLGAYSRRFSRRAPTAARPAQPDCRVV